MKFTVLFLLLFGAAGLTGARAETLSLKPGMVITNSCKIARGVYRLPSADESGKTAAITIRGDNLIVDFAGATLEGTPQTVAPDARRGAGIRVEGRNVTIKNAIVRGYKIGIAALDSPGIKVLSSDLSYNWKQHLASTLAREDESDWMSYHHNEQDEWLRYGAGIYLRRCDGFEARSVVIRDGQCGLMLMECSKGQVVNCDFSFLSAIGLGMYRSSDNRIMHNKIDWCVRGYSHGVYNRGQDSAGILIYEQSDRNLFAYNSVTHGGDGFFLWAGQSTMDTGKGGCNDNLLYGNDFSHAPTNGIEATFSRNRFVNNLVMECWHGLWGGYSYDTQILGNVFAYNAESIAIEHGQDNTIHGNLFYRETDAIHVWQNEHEDPNFGYAKHRDTKSHGYDVANNVFRQISGGRDSTSDSGAVLRLKATSDFTLGSNSYGPVGTLYDVRGPLTNFTFTGGTFRPGAINAPGTKKQSLTVEWQPAKIPSLGTGWDTGHEGHVVAAGYRDNLLPAVMQPSGNLILPYPDGDDGYHRRFITNWNPLKRPSRLTLGANPNGFDLVRPNVEALDPAPPPLAGGVDPFLKQDQLRGRGYILVDQWGPYDFQSPLLWPRTPAGATSESLKLEVLGPKGTWTVKSLTGGTLNAQSGAVPGFLTFTRAKQKGSRVKIELEYIGAKTTDYRGIVTPAGKPVLFDYTEFFVPIDWRVRFYQWDKSTEDPRTHEDAFRTLLKGRPLAQMSAASLDLVPGRIPREVPNDYFATIAEGDFEIEPGDYVLDITTDDGARLYLDGKLLVDEWHYQGPTLYSREVKLGGKHHLRVEHFQIDGYWTLKVGLRLKGK